MASIFAHGGAAWTLGRIYCDDSKLPIDPFPKKRLYFLAIACACMPDADVIGFFLGIPYEALWGHRGMTHSLIFAAFIGIFVTAIFFREIRFGTSGWWKLSGFFALATASHGFLDGFTDGGLGVAYLSPLDPTRYFFPFRPVAVSPLGIAEFLGEWGLRILINEALWIGLPCLLLLLTTRGLRRVKRDAPNDASQAGEHKD